MIGRPRDAGAARRGREAARLARATAATGATTTATASTSTRTRSGSWTPGGRAGSRRSSSPTLGADAFEVLTQTVAIDNPPNNDGEHLGSAYQGSWYGYVSKDLRTVLGRARCVGSYSREYCGRLLARCRAALRRSLARGG